MGSGKSSIGLMVSKKLNIDFIDVYPIVFPQFFIVFKLAILRNIMGVDQIYFVQQTIFFIQWFMDFIRHSRFGVVLKIDPFQHR